MRHDQDLMALQLEGCDHPICDSLHRSAINLVAGIEAECEVIDGLLDPNVLGSGRAHDLASKLGISRGKISRGAPRYAFRFIPRPPCGEILGERAKASRAARHRDHGVALIQASDYVQDVGHGRLELRGAGKMLFFRCRGEAGQAGGNLG
jgi:hypothetical protein